MHSAQVSPEGAEGCGRRRTSRRRVALFVAAASVIGVGAALGWEWLTAAGVVSVLMSFAPCAVMCALGLCMKGGSPQRGASPPPFVE